ncbi:hypothetical protein [Devosia aquimaris]|uniref:hypothetical protein n=1 Tax=Devosia aquimaris TaxID=2866214 RepID=UPI001CD0DBC6|nr:hypothetical protein [Devosia sp. CJK-A8-3]
MRFVVGALIWGAMAVAATAAPGQCVVRDGAAFDCDVALDGSGLTFALPDGQVFAFALIEDGVGVGYLVAPDAAPGSRPDELGQMVPVPDKPGCWMGGRDDFSFCAQVAQ